ncbi:RDD family protein [Actinomadura sp. DC4]|uniref:RDD family protein n=1 Tax=Actinomadura sp. DC4 TaxID=3055069 RepID=UPI0025AFA9D5|nr:RDD family protein [Actinomadura sp. DC4]
MSGLIIRRYVQFGVDRLIASVPAFLVLVLGLHFVLRMPHGGGRLPLTYVTLTVFILVLIADNWFIEVWVPYRWLGGTPGMRCLGLRVITEHGEDPPLRTYTIRWLMVVVDGYFFGLVGALAIAFSARNQRFGDMVARTLVVRRG